MKSSRPPFSAILPALSIGIWITLIVLPTTIAWFNLHQASLRSANRTILNQLVQTGCQHHLLATAFFMVTSYFSHTITVLNLPGMIPDTIISLCISWPNGWHPRGMLMEEWRALVLPFFCLPAWWFVGCAIDATIGRRKLHWSALLGGTLLCALFVVIVCGLTFGISAEDRGEITWGIWGCVLWAILFGAFPLAWVRQRARNKAEKLTALPTST